MSQLTFVVAVHTFRASCCVCLWCSVWLVTSVVVLHASRVRCFANHAAPHCNIIHHTAPHHTTLHHTVTYRNTLQCIAPYCNTATNCNTHCLCWCSAHLQGSAFALQTSRHTTLSFFLFFLWDALTIKAGILEGVWHRRAKTCACRYVGAVRNIFWPFPMCTRWFRGAAATQCNSAAITM